VAGIVRVVANREDVQRATEIGFEKKREGYSPEALVLAVDEVLGDLALSRATVLYVTATEGAGPADTERSTSWFSAFTAIGFSACCLWLVIVLLRMVGPNSTLLGVLGIMIGQSILLSLARGAIRLSVLSVCDSLNDASYPTNLHRFRQASSVLGNIRLRRLRALIVDTAERLKNGEHGLVEDLAEINLTPAASRLVVRLARWNLATRDFLPPYESRWLAYTLAFVFLLTCAIMLERAGDSLPEGYGYYGAAIAGAIAARLSARPRRRLRLPDS
jgi:hypothetical protein